MKIWPFMFAASATLDYRFVVRPDFLDAEQDTLFRERLEIDGSEQDIRTISFSDSKNKTIYCWYQARPILLGEQAQTDSVGRKLFCASGLIADESPSDESVRQLMDMTKKVQPYLEKNLIAFLAADRSWKPTIVPGSDIAADLPAVPVAGPSGHKEGPLPATSGPTTDKPTFNKSTTILTAMMIFSLAFSALLFSKYQAIEMQLADIKSKLPSHVSADAPPALNGGGEPPVHKDAEPAVHKDSEPPVPIHKDPEPLARREQPKNIE
jgi:hypothetical protein